jgi:hypothetical protein
MSTVVPESAPTTQDQILKAVKAVLLDNVEQFTEKNLLISDEDDPPGGIRDFYFAMLWPTGGTFDGSADDGGGILQVFEDAGVSIRVWRKNEKDQTGTAENTLLDPQSGLFELKKKILIAMMQNARLQWEQKFILIDHMRPKSSSDPRTMTGKGGRAADLYLEFSTPFQWQLQP